jgi:hypothetical protein
MLIGWLTCIPAVLLPRSLCPSADGQRMLPPSADGQMPIASVVMGHFRNKENKEKLDNDFRS